MILDFDSTYIEIIRGDTISLKLNLNSGTRECPVYSGMPADSRLEIYIIPPNEPADNAVIVKTLTSDDVGIGNIPTLNLSTDESSTLDLGKYYLTIKMLQGEVMKPGVPDPNSTAEAVDEVQVVTITLVNNKQVFVTGIPSAGGVE
jgi:hypothetical protein